MESAGTLALRLKGTRRYVQGPDLYDALCGFAAARPGLAPIEEPDLLIYRQIRTQVDLEWVEGAVPGKGADVAAVLSFRHAGGRAAIRVRENGAAITERIEYPEERIAGAAAYDLGAKSAALAGPAEFTEAEIATSLNKHLLQALFPEAAGKWLFTRYQADAWRGRDPFASLAVRFETRLGFHLTRSAVEVDGRRRGTLFFSLEAP